LSVAGEQSQKLETLVGLDLAKLAAWMDAQGLGAGPVEDARLLAGGTQNILLRFRRAGREFVLRRPPANPRPQSNRIMEREARLLHALARSRVPHPGLIAVCLDQSVLGAVFYLMEPIDGFNPTLTLPVAVRGDPSVRHRMGIQLVDALAALAAVDYNRTGLTDFGKPDGFLERQVERWSGELDSYAKFKGWSGPAPLGDVGAVGRWLEAHRPARMQPGIIHGDFHVGNAIYAADGTLGAIVDWEMATLGDPLVDLGRLWVSWPEGGEAKPFTMRVEQLDGFPTRREMLVRYAEQAQRDLTHLPWFEVLACYKLGILLEGTHARAQAGLASRETGDRLHASAVALLEEARRITAAN
jgi:aminoglycoside phosphotransferase (APT) family kinase protein